MSSTLKPSLFLAVIFIIGAVTGSALTIGWNAHFRHMPEQRDPNFKKSLMSHLTERLSLTADQQAKILPIVTDGEAKLKALHHDEVQRGSQIFKEINDQISALLTPAQQTELQKMESEREKMFNGHTHPWGPPHDGPPGMNHPPGSDNANAMPPPPPPPPPVDAATNAAPPKS